MQQAVTILVVGVGPGTGLNAVTEGHADWAPKVVHMTDQEWQLVDVGDYIDCLSALGHNGVPALTKLQRHSLFPVAPDSTYIFHLYRTYSMLASGVDTGDSTQIVASNLIANHFNSADSPLAAVVLSEEAWNWARTTEVWLQQLPSQAEVWVMHEDGTLAIMKIPADTVA